jgi:hypothetical protein
MTCIGRCKHGYPCHEKCNSCWLEQFPPGPEREKNAQILRNHYDRLSEILTPKEKTSSYSFYNTAFIAAIISIALFVLAISLALVLK